jgi:hypothetical protein
MRQELNSSRLSRRNLILLAGAGLVTNWAHSSLAYGYAGNKDFWESKDPADWSAEEIAKLLTKSPWAKSVSAERTKTQRDPMATSSAGAGMPGARPPKNSGTGSARMPGGTASSTVKTTTEYKGTVLWESAVPVRAALKTSLPDIFAGQIVLGVTGVPLTRSDSQGALDRVRQLTTLTQKDRQPLEASAVKQTRENATVYLFGFAKEALALTKDVKEVVFVTRMGALGFSAKFNPRDMLYHAQLAV